MRGIGCCSGWAGRLGVFANSYPVGVLPDSQLVGREIVSGRGDCEGAGGLGVFLDSGWGDREHFRTVGGEIKSISGQWAGKSGVFPDCFWVHGQCGRMWDRWMEGKVGQAQRDGVRESVCLLPTPFHQRRTQKCSPLLGILSYTQTPYKDSHALHRNTRIAHPPRGYPHITFPTGIPTYHTLIMNTHISHPHHEYPYTKTCTRTVYIFPIPNGNTHPMRNTHTWIPL